MKDLHLGYDAEDQPLHLPPEQRRTHMHVIGSSGSGKSKFLEWMIRGDLRSRQGFALLDPHGTLYNEVLAYCAHHVLNRDIILLNLSTPTSIVGFNPFQKSNAASVSVQVDRRIAATMHAWNVESTDQTPTLERTLRLIYTVMLDQNLGLPQVQHLIDFNARDIRSHLVDQLNSPLVQAEWRELQQLKAREWRDEILSAKNRLFRFLTSPALTRFMGLPERTLDLKAVMDEGKILLVNLAPSDELSEENARVFGALLVNEFFECARRRQKDSLGRDPKPYYLYMDEFQSFVSLDIADMLDQVRKFGLFTILSHQRFGHLDENITDAVLTNCRIKAVFGGLPAGSARMMAEELFIRELDAKKIKVAIYQTKFWPKEERREVRTRSSSHSSSTGWMENSATGSSSTVNAGEFFGPSDWFGRGASQGTSKARASGNTWASSRGSSGSDSFGDSESVADIPVFVPVPFQEFSSVQYYTHEEQLTELTAALKEQYARHCFIKIHTDPTQAMLVPRVESLYTSPKSLTWYESKRLDAYQSLPAADVDTLIAARETALLQAVKLEALPYPSRLSAGEFTTAQIWTRAQPQNNQPPTPATVPSVPQRPGSKRGPKADRESHNKVANIVTDYGDDWTLDEHLFEICERLDKESVSVPKTWPVLREHPVRTWTRALEHHRDLLKKAIRYACEEARKQKPLGIAETPANSGQSL